MSAFQTHALDAVAFQLVAALERYDLDTGRMIAGWPELELYGCVGERLETIRMYASSLPQVRVQWMELLISHAELVHVLWRVENAGAQDTRERIDALRERHADCVAALRKRCMRVIAASGTTA